MNDQPRQSTQPQDEMDYQPRQPTQPQDKMKDQPKQPTQPQDDTTRFLTSLASTKVSKNAAYLKLARKMNERSKILQKKWKQKERIREMTKKLKTTEAELNLVNESIKFINGEIAAGSDIDE